MAKKCVWIAMILVLCACIQQSFAMGELIEVTKENQAELGLNYTLVADRVDAEAVLVSMEIPRKGKLKDLRSVSMRVGSGRPLVAAPLQTSPGKDGSWVITFQLAPNLADKCSVDLIVPVSGRTYVVYAVQLKGYVKDRK
ncbi:MAG TPA: hypothetical protein VKU00_16520 [Chthonomonadaceae bacterium]|nr:hypothetical protein [Chthonomonadaceae bacterium]